MLKLHRSGLLRAATGLALAAAVLLPLGVPLAAHAWWVRGGWGGGLVVGVVPPPVYIAPPPAVVYAPAPAYYGPPPGFYAPPPRGIWIPGHWVNGYFVRGHWG